MFGIGIVAHAPLAEALYKGLEHVYGSIEGCCYVDVHAHDTLTSIESNLSIRCASLFDLPERLILVDLYGATPANGVMKMFANLDSDLRATSLCISGCNLPLLLKAYSMRNTPLFESISGIVSSAKKGIEVFNLQGNLLSHSTL